eukprot:Em0005g316a
MRCWTLCFRSNRRPPPPSSPLILSWTQQAYAREMKTKTIRGSVWLSTRLLGVSVRAWSSNTAVDHVPLGSWSPL